MSSSNSVFHISGTSTVPVITGTYEDICKIVQKWVANHGTHHEHVYRLHARVEGKDIALVKVVSWNPHTCQGMCFPEILLSTSDPLEVTTWTRWSNEDQSAAISQKTPEEMYAEFEELFQVLITSIRKHFEIGPLSHDSAYDALYSKLITNPNSKIFERIEFRNQFYGCNDDELEKQRIMNLCCKLLENSAVEELLFENLKSYTNSTGDAKLVQQLWEAVKLSKHLHTLDLRDCRYMTTWNRESRRNHSTSTDGEKICIISLLSALQPIESLPSDRLSLPPLTKLDLTGNLLTNASAFALARALPKLSLQTLILRDTGLEEISLLHLVEGVKDNVTLKELDISHNDFTMGVVQQLCDSLQENTTLETLTMEHCSITYEHVRHISQCLPSMKGIRHLSMDGNVFTWDPLDETETTGPSSLGAALLVEEALEQNTTLLSLSIGEYGKYQPVGRVCCTPPYYSPVLARETSEKYHRLLERNKQIYLDFRRTKLQQAVIKISMLLVAKISH